jgi:hypothetical protein
MRASQVFASAIALRAREGGIKLLLDDLKRDLFMKIVDAGGFVDGAHAAGADAFTDPVSPEAFAGQAIVVVPRIRFRQRRRLLRDGFVDKVRRGLPVVVEVKTLDTGAQLGVATAQLVDHTGAVCEGSLVDPAGNGLDLAPAVRRHLPT